VRTLVLDDQPWFAAKDVCSVLGIANSRRVAASLDDDEVRVYGMRTPSGRQQMQLVNESGLYNLIFRSRKAEAKAFRRWVTSEVLPAIRRTGGYQQPPRAKALPPAAPKPPRLGQKPHAPQHWDARHLPYDRIAWLQGEVRAVVLASRAWYCLADAMRCLGVTTHGSAVSRTLPHNHRHMIMLYGETHPAWFVDDVGLRMVAVARGHRIGQLSLDLNANTR
jgi:prophage antirepressor-like protein